MTPEELERRLRRVEQRVENMDGWMVIFFIAIAVLSYKACQ